MKRTYSTNLRCAACVAHIRPAFDAAAGISRWSVDLDSADKRIAVEGIDVSRPQIDLLLAPHGYATTGEVRELDAPPAEPEVAKTSFYPLLLLVSYLLAGTLLHEWSLGEFSSARMMRHFMAGFFLAFSFFKLLDLPAFSSSYAMYDLVAARWRGYGYVYPFLELLLGCAYLSNWQPVFTNAFTLILATVSSLGVARALLERKQIRCACLGSVFNLPMTWVTLIEDAAMAVMAGWMLVMH